MDITIYPDPNPGIGEALVGNGMRRAVEERINMALLLYQAQVAKRTGALAASAHATTELGPVLKGQDRWVGVLTVGGRGVDYALPHEFGRGEHPGSIHNLDGEQSVQRAADDLNVVLEQLGSF